MSDCKHLVSGDRKREIHLMGDTLNLCHIELQCEHCLWCLPLKVGIIQFEVANDESCFLEPWGVVTTSTNRGVFLFNLSDTKRVKWCFLCFYDIFLKFAFNPFLYSSTLNCDFNVCTTVGRMKLSLYNLVIILSEYNCSVRTERSLKACFTSANNPIHIYIYVCFWLVHFSP